MGPRTVYHHRIYHCCSNQLRYWFNNIGAKERQQWQKKGNNGIVLLHFLIWRHPQD
ncbi:MAG: hypothetical protein AVDCRST_MAG56-5214 [uncultured Cytophagales bacterium]|uniref:Uncharacterized protein n=1 Tax=uncultured Cytophagales bacterium TaxID=158755 RepID=A0A6J4K9M2_9SPHI|nr:MAG: hypothetical protein AVDCRST_MAG56-5214 [uncultured Cytophagales bacterium]